MSRNAMPREVIAAVADAGFDVYMRGPSDSWLYYTDGTRLAYLENAWAGGFKITTAHVPNQSNGTGFVMVDDASLSDLTRDTLVRGFATAPDWASQRDRVSVVKWKDWAAFTASNRFNGEYQLAAPATRKAVYLNDGFGPVKLVDVAT